MSALGDLVGKIAARRRAALANTPTPQLARRVQSLSSSENVFLAALTRRRAAAVIAEVKLASPRSGPLLAEEDAERQARVYAEAGAAALSVVVEPDFFGGSYSLLSRCRAASGLPAIAKDFVVSPMQLQWARDAGADAVLLIARLYDPSELAMFASQARGLGLVPLIEVHCGEEIEGLVKGHGSAWELVGVNNRDLSTFEVDLGHSIEVLSTLPSSAIKVAESGIRSAGDLERLSAAGFDAFLIGEALLRAEDPRAKLREFVAFGTGEAR